MCNTVSFQLKFYLFSDPLDDKVYIEINNKWSSNKIALVLQRAESISVTLQLGLATL